ncbi:Hypothetical protein HDN1F_21830 [gamma proteobacterium HdN1]|nr:Hypothetical protein HDN1F_21830 [gamma proteobacterium HdN1]
MEKKSAHPNQETRPQYEYVYHWNRIVPIVGVIVAVAGAATWLWPSSTADQATPTAAVSTQEDSIPSNAGTANKIAAHPAQSALTTSTTASATKSATSASADKHIVVNLPTISAKKPTENPAKAAPSTTESAAAVATTTAQTNPKPAETANANRSAALKAINEAPAPAAGIRPGQIYIADKRLKDVTLQQIIDHDPLALERGSISVGKKKAVRVVFSANTGKPNEQVNYHWYLDGKLKASVATRSDHDAKSTSSKFVSYFAPGAWQVQVVDRQGKLLAASAFNAKRMD